jgi:hypothetical protein
MKKYLIILLLTPLPLFSQIFNQKSDLIKIKYESSLDNLINKNHKINQQKEGLLGWRVQLTFKSTKEEIKRMRVNFIKLYPNIPTYLTYDSPYYRICVGNFRSKNEAIKLNDFIRKNYIEAYPVQKIIPISLLRN